MPGSGGVFQQHADLAGDMGAALVSAFCLGDFGPHRKSIPLAVRVDGVHYMCIDLCMATKTLSVDEEAYRKLVRARKHVRESFSKIIKRAKWDDGPPRCGDLLARADGEVSDETLGRLEDAQAEDAPPVDKWNR